MSLFSRLFHRQEQPDAAVSLLLNWPGQSGTQYPYEIHPIDDSFRGVPGNYIYARQAEDGNWIPVYIAQTRDLNQRLEGHVRTQDAVAHGATHIHVHLSSAGPAARSTEEQDLVRLWHPECNEAA
jgi:hypothetical protein